MPESIQPTPVLTANPLFDPDHPPLLKDHATSAIEGILPVYGQSKVESGVIGYDIWGRLNALGGYPQGGLPGMFGAVVIGSELYQQQVLHPLINSGSLFLFNADLIVTDLWQLVEGPTHTSRNGTDSFTEEFNSSVEQLQSVTNTLEVGLSATVGAEGFGMSAEVTASLTQSVTSMVQLTKTSGHSQSRTVEREVEKDHTYALWRKYRRVDLRIKPQYASGNNYLPFDQNVIDRLLPVTITCFSPLTVYGDSVADQAAVTA